MDSQYLYVFDYATPKIICYTIPTSITPEEFLIEEGYSFGDIHYMLSPLPVATINIDRTKIKTRD